MNHLIETARLLVKDYQERGLKMATAESCTGGLVAMAITEIAGSSAVFERGFVTYSNEAKIECLGVPKELIETHGAVSGEVARAMAEGALKNSHADVAVSITGIAGPTGGSEKKPVGTVWFGIARRGDEAMCEHWRFDGDRAGIRHAAAAQALAYFAKQLV
jgi:nicotinamide-nucleotide amidase